MRNKNSKYCNCLYYASNALSRIMTKMADEAFATTGLSSSYAFLLMTVIDNPGIQPKEISEKMQLTASTITRLVEKMEFRGYLIRKNVGRASEVYPTKDAIALQPKIKEAWSNLYKKYSEVLGVKSGQQLTSDIYEATMKFQ